jgi:hypothetical protein
MTSYASLITALMAVETGGYRNPDAAVGDGGKAIGALQIHRSVVKDVNHFYGTSYNWEGMTNRADARKVCDLYLRKWAKGKSLRDAARIWNGGPSAHLKENHHKTAGYVAKVNRHIDLDNTTLAKN